VSASILKLSFHSFKQRNQEILRGFVVRVFACEKVVT